MMRFAAAAIVALGLILAACQSDATQELQPSPSSDTLTGEAPARSSTQTPVQPTPTPFPTLAPIVPLAGWTCPQFASDIDKPGIYVYDTQTCEVTRATGGDADGLELSWSPDGTKIAYTRHESESYSSGADIYLKDLRTGDVTPMTFTPDERESDPHWSFDGSNITFFSVGLDEPDGPSKRHELKSVNVDEPGQLNTMRDDLCYSRQDWSPVRAEILLVTNCGELAGRTLLLNGTGNTIREYDLEGGSWGDRPWAPDGESFITGCNFYANGYVSTICVVRRDGSVVQVQEDGNYPSWTLDGNVSYVGGRNFYVADPATGVAISTIAGWRGQSSHWVSADRVAVTMCTREHIAPCPMVWALVDPQTLGTTYLVGIGCGGDSAWSPSGRYLAIAVGHYPIGCL